MVINSARDEQHEARPCLYCRRCLQEVLTVRGQGLLAQMLQICRQDYKRRVVSLHTASAVTLP